MYCIIIIILIISTVVYDVIRGRYKMYDIRCIQSLSV